MYTKKQIRPTKYFDPEKWLNSIRVKELRCPKPKMSSSLNAIETSIQRENIRNDRVERLNGCIGRMYADRVVKATDGSRVLLVRPERWLEYEPLGLSEPGPDHLTINNPDFYNAIKRASVDSDYVTIQFNSETWELTLSSQGEQVSAEETMTCPQKHSPPDIEFSLNAKYLLNLLGSWPVTIHYESGRPNKPLLFEFRDYSVLIMPLKASECKAVAA